MTERTLSVPPHTATSIQSASHAVTTNGSRDGIVFTESVDEEPYTIKCICDYSDDDGNTIYCESCDTWQHIECFYHGNAEEASRDDFNHFCADCKPRVLDRRKATERQRQQREDRPLEDASDKKTKRPPSKSHKKKPKLTDVQTNGYHDHDGAHNHKNGSPHEHTSHAKKSKSHHRSHHSVSSQATKHSPSHHARSHSHAHPLSPANTPPDLPEDFLIHSYSKQLQDLCHNDPGPQELQANSFASLTVTNTMSLWLRDSDRLREDAEVQDPRDIFQMIMPSFDWATQSWPQLKVRSKEIKANDTTLRLRYLTIVKGLSDGGTLVGELKGFVGFQKDYPIEESERYELNCHSAPFVFFHPSLPLYIDTRREGSQCRYIRRSCRPNCTLETCITNQSEYHFMITNERSILPGEQITLAWDFKFPAEFKARYLHLLGLSDDDGTDEPDVTPTEYDELTGLIHNVLSDYGGCACDLGADCAFARFHRKNYHGRVQAEVNEVKVKKGRRPKQHISPNSTGHATNSRDASEGHQEAYDGEDDNRSTSGSTKSKPQSRDMTPLPNGDLNGIDIRSEREKRKAQDIEKLFEKNDQAQPARKKPKRLSDGPPSAGLEHVPVLGLPKAKQKSVSRVSVNTATTQMNGFNSRSYKDASTSRQHSNSPSELSPKTAIQPTSREASRQPSLPLRSRQQSLAPSNYVDSSCQTDIVEDAWYSESRSPTPKKKHLPLAKRLLNNQHRARTEREALRIAQMTHMTNGVENHANGHILGSGSIAQEASNVMPPIKDIETNDVEMTIASTEDNSTITDVAMPDAPTNNTETPHILPPSWSGVLQPTSSNPSPQSAHRQSDMKVQMPPIPTFSTASQAMPPTPSGSLTPVSTSGSVAQSPFGSIHYPTAFSPSMVNSVIQPSPIKKKMSFKEYNARKKPKPEDSNARRVENSSDSHMVSTSSSSLADEVKFPTILEGSAIIVESPIGEKTTDSLAAVGIILKDEQTRMNGATDTSSKDERSVPPGVL